MAGLSLTQMGLGLGLLGTTTDASASAGVYEAEHVIAITGLTVTVNRNLYRYMLVFQGEAGGNFIAGANLLNWDSTITYSSLPWPY